MAAELTDAGRVHAGPALTEPAKAGVALPIDGVKTVCEAFQANVARLGHRTAVGAHGQKAALSWRMYGERVREVAGGLAGLGVRRAEPVALMLTARPEFYVVDTAVQHLGAIPFSLYNTAPAEQIAPQLRGAGVRTVITERMFLDTVKAATGLGAHLDHVIVVDGTEDEATTELTLDEVVARTPADFDFERAWRSVSADDVATLIYTSGTTGPPKAVELTHANLLAQWQMLARIWPIRPYGRVISYLPSAHIADRTVGIYCVNMMGFTATCLADPRQLVSALQDTRPTLFLAVPRTWEKIRAAIDAAVTAHPDSDFRQVYAEGVAAGLRRIRAEQAGQPVDPDVVVAHDRAESEVFAVLRRQFGFDQVETFMTGAAPVPLAVHEYFAALGMALPEVWGMSESSAIVTWNPPGGIRFGTVGVPLPGTELMLAEDGEILVRGPSVMRGYRNDPDRTAEAIDADGWLHTGDVGAWDADGYLRLVDRKKELIINSAGKNMSPMNIEGEIKAAGELIGQVCVVGDGRRYNVALLVLDPDAAAAFARQHGLRTTDVTALCQHPAVLVEISGAVERANAKLSRVEQIKRWSVLPNVWEPAGDEMTPTMKLRRRQVEAKYAAEIDALYAADDATD